MKKPDPHLYENLAPWKEPAMLSVVDNTRTPNSLRVNVLGETQKICSFNCCYCEFGATEIRLNQVKALEGIPDVEDIQKAVSDKLRELIEADQAPERLVLAGPGEPTLHPRFADLTTMLIELRNEILPELKLSIVVNGTYLDQRKVLTQVEKYDEKFCKLDAGNERSLKNMNNPLVRTSTERILEAYRKLESVTIMSFFINGAVCNTTDDDLADWMEVLGIIQPNNVILTTLTRPSWHEGLIPLSEDDLEIIAAKLRMKMGIVAKTPN